MKHAISQYSFAGKAQDYPEDFNFDIMNFGRAWVGGGHKLSTQNKSIYGASVYIEFNSDDIYESSDANEVCVFLTDTTPAQGAFIDSLNIIFTTTFNAPQKGFYDVRFNAPIDTSKDVFLFAYGVRNGIKYSNKLQPDNTPFTKSFYFINRENVSTRANISVYDTNWLLQPTVIFYTEKSVLQKEVLKTR